MIWVRTGGSSRPKSHVLTSNVKRQISRSALSDNHRVYLVQIQPPLKPNRLNFGFGCLRCRLIRLTEPDIYFSTGGQATDKYDKDRSSLSKVLFLFPYLLVWVQDKRKVLYVLWESSTPSSKAVTSPLNHEADGIPRCHLTTSTEP